MKAAGRSVRWGLWVGATALVALVIPSSALPWQSNTFTNPGRTIHCQYFAYGSPDGRIPGGTLTCMRANDKVQVAVSSWYAQKAWRVYDWPDPVATPFTPIARYGTTVTTQRIQCHSGTDGMACRTSHGHGFLINRLRVQVW